MDDGAAHGWLLLKRESACVSRHLGAVAREADRPKQIPSRSTTSTRPYSAQLEPAHYAGFHQI
jgi:hypothetical protein